MYEEACLTFLYTVQHNHIFKLPVLKMCFQKGLALTPPEETCHDLHEAFKTVLIVGARERMVPAVPRLDITACGKSKFTFSTFMIHYF